MKLFGAHISYQAIEFFNTNLLTTIHYETANKKLFDSFGINSFFRTQQEFLQLKDATTSDRNIVSEYDRIEYGDFQTNLDLAKDVVKYLKNEKGVTPSIVVEPTCGKGNFIIAALSEFNSLKNIIAVEIYEPYIWETKFNIIDFYLTNPANYKPIIQILTYNVFDFNFRKLATEFRDEILVLGNPPWVTNSKLGSLDSRNLPVKSNFKNYSGYDAITGKGNFDIGEFITLMMLDSFQHSIGHIAFLIKNAVIKNIVFDQNQRKYMISGIEKLTINSKKEFDVSVEASLFFCRLNSSPGYNCKEYNFYNNREVIREFGWINDKFVSNIDFYLQCKDIEGTSPFEWRQGIKHDLSSIMELDKFEGHYINGKQEKIFLEEDLIFGLLKSSDLKEKVIKQSRKFSVVTQKKIGQDTSFIKINYPLTFSYLKTNKEYFDKRKSSIYLNKPDYSIFGIGDYSFQPFKVAISGLYKTFNFSLILPLNDKPLMLDDTCYFLGFDNLEFAAYTTVLLNSDRTKEFLKAISFNDAKRTFTKDILMRIDLSKLASQLSEQSVKKEINSLTQVYDLNISLDKWQDYLKILNQKQLNNQLNIFDIQKTETQNVKNNI